MERESFESKEIAELMNKHFVNIKVGMHVAAAGWLFLLWHAHVCRPITRGLFAGGPRGAAGRRPCLHDLCAGRLKDVHGSQRLAHYVGIIGRAPACECRSYASLDTHCPYPIKYVAPPGNPSGHTGRPGLQATSGSGGWPMSAFLTPDLLPFYGGALLARGVVAGAGPPVSEPWCRRCGCARSHEAMVLSLHWVLMSLLWLPSCAPLVKGGAALSVQRDLSLRAGVMHELKAY